MNMRVVLTQERVSCVGPVIHHKVTADRNHSFEGLGLTVFFLTLLPCSALFSPHLSRMHIFIMKLGAAGLSFRQSCKLINSNDFNGTVAQKYQ